MASNPSHRQPDFENTILKVLQGKRPVRATLFELFLSPGHQQRLAQIPCPGDTPTDQLRVTVSAMAHAGYDYASTHASQLWFKRKTMTQRSTRCLNDNVEIWDWESFENFVWPDMRAQDYSRLEKIRPYLPEGMKLMVMGPGGVLENVIKLVGYDNLCIMLHEEPELAKAVFDNVGARLVEYYDNSVGYDTVGMVCSNDDWGFNTQTFLSPAMMREYLFPWHRRIVEIARKYGKPILLHSCGNYTEIIDDVIELGYNARHSYEDNILPVEQAYEDLHDRIAVLGGIDIHFLTTKTPEEISGRCRQMLERTWDRGGYALGSGNSIADFIPAENYTAMLSAAHEFNGSGA